jgi:hypothetical protein
MVTMASERVIALTSGAAPVPVIRTDSETLLGTAAVHRCPTSPLVYAIQLRHATPAVPLIHVLIN